MPHEGTVLNHHPLDLQGPPIDSFTRVLPRPSSLHCGESWGEQHGGKKKTAPKNYRTSFTKKIIIYNSVQKNKLGLLRNAYICMKMMLSTIQIQNSNNIVVDANILSRQGHSAHHVQQQRVISRYRKTPNLIQINVLPELA